MNEPSRLSIFLLLTWTMMSCCSEAKPEPQAPSEVEGPAKAAEPAKRAPSMIDTPSPDTEEKKPEEEKPKPPKEECQSETHAISFQEAVPNVEGIVIERRVQLFSRDLVGKQSEIHRTETVKILGNVVVIDDTTFGTRLIIRPDLELAWVIDLPSATYSEVTFAALAERRQRVLADLAEASKRVVGTPDAADIEKILVGLGTFATPPTVEVKETGTSMNVAGRGCVGREIVVNGTDHPLEVAVDPTLTDALAYFDALARMGAFHPAVAQKIRDLGGFPLKGNVRYTLFLDRILSQEEVLSVTKRGLPGSDMALPGNLRRVPLKGFGPDTGPKPEKPKALDPSFREDDIDRDTHPVQQEKDKKEPK